MEKGTTLTPAKSGGDRKTANRRAAGARKQGAGRSVAGNGRLSDEELLDTALRSFAERGFEGTSVRDLCRQLGVSHNLIHQRFGSKDELWYAAVDHGFESLTFEMMEAVLAVGGGDDLDRIRAVLVRFIEVTAASPALVRVINQEGVHPGPRLDYIYKRHIRSAMKLVGEMLDRLSADGRVRPITLTVFYFLMANGATGPVALPALAERFPDAPASKRKADLHEYAESVVDLLFDGFVAD
jgi:AcrR family transcriptional regulator